VTWVRSEFVSCLVVLATVVLGMRE
jgi:hypothetical protein